MELLDKFSTENIESLLKSINDYSSMSSISIYNDDNSATITYIGANDSIVIQTDNNKTSYNSYLDFLNYLNNNNIIEKSIILKFLLK